MPTKTTTAWDYSTQKNIEQISVLPAWIPTTPAEVSDPTTAFSERIATIMNLRSYLTAAFDIIFVGVFYYVNSKKRCSKKLMILADSIEIVISIANTFFLLYALIFNKCDDVALCKILNFLAITCGHRTLMVNAITSIEGISHNIRKANLYPHFNDLLLYNILSSLATSAFVTVTGSALTEMSYECCEESHDCMSLLTHHPVRFWFWIPFLVVFFFLHLNVKLMDYRVVAGGNYKSPAAYNEARLEATWYEFNFGLFLVGWVSYIILLYLGYKTKYTMCFALLLPAIRPFIQLGIRLFFDKKFRENFVSTLSVVCCNKQPFVWHDRHRRRNRRRLERAARRAATEIALEPMAPRDPVADSDRNNVVTYV